MRDLRQWIRLVVAATAVAACWHAAAPSARAGLLAAWEFSAADVAAPNVAASGGTAANTTGVLQADATIASGALDLDGTGDYLQFGNDLTELRGLSTMTLSAWVNPDSSSTALRRIVEHEDNIYFWTENNTFRFTIHGTPGGVADGQAFSTTAPAVGAWQHVLVTYEANQPGKIYINGVLEGTSNGNFVQMPTNVQTFQIGSRRSSSGAATNFWDGQIDDVAIWDQILTQDDIDDLAGVGVGGYAMRTVPTLLGAEPPPPPPPSGATLLARYSMDNGHVAGDTIIDSAGFPLGPFNGAKQNGGPTTGVPGRFGQAAEFAGGANNGFNEHIDLSPHANLLSTLGEGTISAFIKPDTTDLTTDVLTIFAASDASAPSSEIRWFVSNGGATGFGNLVYGTRGADINGNVVTSGVDLLDGQWHHVAVTVSSSDAVALYIDGELRGAGTATFFDGFSVLNSLSLGRNLDSTVGGGQWFFDGLMDEVRIYDRAMNPDEVARLASIPEPSTFVLASLAAAMTVWQTRRRTCKRRS
ncbi:MAG: LamG domain-containing protein [Pirellulales bacterium]